MITGSINIASQTKKHGHHPQKYPLWIPWLTSLLLLLFCIALVILLVMPFSHGAYQPTVLQQKFMEWECVSEMPQHKGRGWMCCPKSWKRFKKSCYYMSVDMMNWDNSEQNCTGMGSHLVVINTTAEQTFLTEVLQQSPRGTNYYIGLTAPAVGQWQWVDQTPYNESAVFWRSKEPSNVPTEMCVVIHTKKDIKNWNDVPCENHYRICEAAAETV
ncbi:C-type lectin domain family 4 member D-like isoform X2 [Phaenicophaeus curvirostris]|uniref:C-type lectin domain family 4 member D-like isoform X2 n=1 Tax=Phaenicophaeus curvirostris TaxID=33595 RepID=UPI0037F0C18B